jgi:hypothetical protein
MIYSYTQISQYLTCPRRYRHRYLDGWKEKDTRAAMLFGRAFEQALGALYSAGKIPEQSCSPNGLPARNKSCTTPTATPGIACSGRESCCLTDNLGVVRLQSTVLRFVSNPGHTT